MVFSGASPRFFKNQLVFFLALITDTEFEGEIEEFYDNRSIGSPEYFLFLPFYIVLSYRPIRDFKSECSTEIRFSKHSPKFFYPPGFHLLAH